MRFLSSIPSTSLLKCWRIRQKTKKPAPNPGPAFEIALEYAYIFGSGPTARVVLLLLREFELLP